MVPGLRVAVLLGILVLFSPLFAQNETKEERANDVHHCFFEENTISLGVGPKSSLTQNLTGFNTRLYYNMGEHWCFGPEFSWIHSGEKDVKEISIVGHYILETPWVGIYPLAGGTYSQEDEGEHGETGLGMTYGAGMHRNFGQVTCYIEYSAFIGFARDQFWGVGVMYNFKI